MPFARHKHRRERPPSFPAESSRLPKSEGMATVAMRAVAPAAARASSAFDAPAPPADAWSAAKEAESLAAEFVMGQSAAIATKEAR